MNCEKLFGTFDWTSTSLGPKSHWPESLIASISICLLHPQPSCVLWGEDQVQIYNDRFAVIIGDKHPAAFGSVARKTWSNEWELRGKMTQTIWFEGKIFQIDNLKLSIPIAGVKQDRYFNVTVTPIKSSKGIVGLFSTAIDITDIILQENILRKLKMEQLKDLFLLAPVALAIFIGPEFIVEVANDAMLKLWGRSARKMTGKPVFDSIPEAREQGFEELLNKVLKTGERIVLEQIPLTLNKKAKAEKMLIKLIYAPLKEANGKITGVLVLADEVTNQVYARKRLEENEERLKIAVLSTGMGTWEYDAIAKTFSSSHECRVICGIPETEKFNVEMFRQTMLAEEQRKFDYAAAKASVDGTGKFHLVHRIVRHDDKQVRWIQSWGTIIFNRAGHPEKFIGTLIDVTPQHRRHESLVANS